MNRDRSTSFLASASGKVAALGLTFSSAAYQETPCGASLLSGQRVGEMQASLGTYMG